MDFGFRARPKVLFINMPLRASAPPNCAPYGVLLLTAILRREGVDANVLDLNVYRREGGAHIEVSDAESMLDKFLVRHGEQDVIAVSGMITTLRWQTAVTAMARRLQPDAFIVSGGGLATEFGSSLFGWLPEVDAVAVGEGDMVIGHITKDAVSVRRGRAASAHFMGKISHEKNGRPKLVYVGARPPCLDSLPFPAFEALKTGVDGGSPLATYMHNQIWGAAAKNSSETMLQQELSLNTVSSRGCPFACKYCYRMSTGGKVYGARSAQSLATEMAWMKEEFGVNFVGVLDDNFMVNRNRILEMPHIFKSAGINGVKWGTHGRLDEAADLRQGSRLVPRRVDSMAEAGCVYIGFGGESASPRMLEAMGKGGFTLRNGTVTISGHEFPKSYVEGIRNTRDAGIQSNCTWIIGYPGEHMEDLQATVAFMKWQESEMGAGVNKNMFVATAYPGTEMFCHPKVAERLRAGYGINYCGDGSPVADEKLRDYVLDLDDATKVLFGKDGRPMNFSEIEDDKFLEAKSYVETENTEKILEMAA